MFVGVLKRVFEISTFRDICVNTLMCACLCAHCVYMSACVHLHLYLCAVLPPPPPPTTNTRFVLTCVRAFWWIHAVTSASHQSDFHSLPFHSFIHLIQFHDLHKNITHMKHVHNGHNYTLHWFKVSKNSWLFLCKKLDLTYDILICHLLSRNEESIPLTCQAKSCKWRHKGPTEINNDFAEIKWNLWT